MKAENSHLRAELDKFARKFSLSVREQEVVSLLVCKITHLEMIAKSMKLSPNTVRNHLQSIFQKTRTKSKTELLAGFIGDVFVGLPFSQEMTSL